MKGKPMKRLFPEKVFWGTGVCLFLSMFSGVQTGVSAATLEKALTDGTPSLNLRYRFEWVDQEGIKKKADASTVRSTLGYKTGDFMKFSAFVEFEDVRPVGFEKFNSTANGKTDYPVVADPEDTEINQASLSYTASETTNIILGRQRIVLDNQRFIGDVGWRQNQQTFDALLVKSGIIPLTDLTYAYIGNVNRIFGEHHPANADFSMRSHIVHLAYSAPNFGRAVAYGYFLNFEEAGLDQNDNATVGLRFSGSYGPNDGVTLLYTAEYATQNDLAEGSNAIDADYLLLEGGGVLKGVTAKLSYEKLGGDGTYGFSTPLATGHAFQGWADKFLSTPADGIRDLFLTVSGKRYGVSVAVIYHSFSSDHGGYDYGDEMDMVAGRDFGTYYGASLKYAAYHADSNPDNVGGPSTDVNKLWLTGTFKF